MAALSGLFLAFTNRPLTLLFSIGGSGFTSCSADAQVALPFKVFFSHHFHLFRFNRFNLLELLFSHYLCMC